MKNWKKNKILMASLVILSFIIVIMTKLAIVSNAEEEMKEPPSNDGMYEISSLAELRWFADYVNNNDSSASAKLMKNINMNDSSCEQIGTSENYYKGTFNGNGKKLVCLNAKGAIFNYSEGMIKNLKIEGGKILGERYASGICSNNYGDIINCSVSVNISSVYAAGICEYNEGTISMCYNEGLVKGVCNVSGICVDNRGTISDCYNAGVVICENQNSYTAVAGIAINNDNGSVANSISYGKVDNSVGELYLIANGNTTNCYSLDDDVDFESGEVTYLLNNQSTKNVVWGQKLGKDNYPSFSSHVVYYGYDYCIETYANDRLNDEPIHEFSDKMIYDDDAHFYKCNYCDERDREQAHSMTEYRHYDMDGHISNCTVCNYDRYRRHNWNEGTVTVEPTVDINGMLVKDCDTCKGKKEVEIGLDIELPILDAVDYIQEEGFIKTTFKIEIKASDIRSGLKEIYYSFIPNDKVIDDNVVEMVTWNKYEESFKYDTKSYDSLYIKVIDNCDNYIITDSKSAVLLENNEKGNKFYWIRDIKSY